MAQTLVLTISGDDQPGVTAGLTTTLAQLPIQISQLEQIVLQGHLVLGLVLAPTEPEHIDATIAAATSFAQSRNMDISARLIADGERDLWRERIAVTVLGNPLVPAAVAAITTAIAAHGGNIDRIRQVARHPVTAVEFEVGGVPLLELRAELATVARRNGIDIAVQVSGLDRRGVQLVVMDVDSTLIQEEVIELLADVAGVGDQVTDITQRAMNGELDFEASLRERVALLAGLPATVLEDVQQRITLTPGADTLVRTLHRLGFHVALVSGGFLEVVAPLANRLGVERFRANQLEVRNGQLTGSVSGPIVDRKAKAAALREFADELHIPLSRTVAIGDGANDLDMLHAAALGIAFNAKPHVRDAADTSVTTPYLDSVLYVMGIPRHHVDAVARHEAE